MPLYESKCRKCGETFEVIQKFSDLPLETHDNCGGHVERLLSPPALQFKGSGWYVTDYAGGNGKSQPAGEAKKETKSGSSTESSKTETKASTTPGSTSDKKV
jgi:putative FmdB family regulatory protein